MGGDYMSYVWRMWRKRDIQHHDEREDHVLSQGRGHPLHLVNHVNLSMGRKVVFAWDICGLLNITVLN